jgi:tetratricopeptide (TPR) repeat protein
MKSIKRQDVIHLEAAQGWLELGNHLEANLEFERISAGSRSHPDVLEVRWKICAVAKKWNGCLRVAETLTDVAPERITAWLFLASSLHKLDLSEEACETLLSVVNDFPDNPAISYELASLFCQLGDVREARQWLKNAFTIGDAKELRQLALADASLKPLWGKMREI